MLSYKEVVFVNTIIFAKYIISSLSYRLNCSTDAGCDEIY